MTVTAVVDSESDLEFHVSRTCHGDNVCDSPGVSYYSDLDSLRLQPEGHWQHCTATGSGKLDTDSTSSKYMSLMSVTLALALPVAVPLGLRVRLAAALPHWQSRTHGATGTAVPDSESDSRTARPSGPLHSGWQC